MGLQPRFVPASTDRRPGKQAFPLLIAIENRTLVQHALDAAFVPGNVPANSIGRHLLTEITKLSEHFQHTERVTRRLLQVAMTLSDGRLMTDETDSKFSSDAVWVPPLGGVSPGERLKSRAHQIKKS